jgi:hypothetical protein
MKVFVYFNLHKKLFSVKALEGSQKGRVVAHVVEAMLYDAKLKVSQSGRERVIREKRKNVHAGVQGDWFGGGTFLAHQMARTARPITYNPYKYSSFVFKDTENPVHQMKEVALVVYNNRAGMYGNA